MEKETVKDFQSALVEFIVANSADITRARVDTDYSNHMNIEIQFKIGEKK